MERRSEMEEADKNSKIVGQLAMQFREEHVS